SFDFRFAWPGRHSQRCWRGGPRASAGGRSGRTGGKMEIARRNWPDVTACLLIAAFGLAVAAGGLDYQVGTLTRMGPGFFPVMLGLLVFALAVGAAIEAVHADAPGMRFRLRPLFFVSLGVLAWALLIEDTGII